jgi:PAS domain S-box-containing protein
MLAVLSVLTAVPVLWLGNGYAIRTADNDRRAHDQSLVNLAQSVARQTDTMLDGRCRDLEVLAGSVEVLGELDGPRVQALMERHWERAHYYTGTYVADADGNALVRAPVKNPEHPANNPANYRDRDYYRELVRTGRTAISGVQKGRFLHVINIQIATPIHDGHGALAGYAEGSVELDTFAALVRAAAARVPGSRLVVLDGTSRVVADSAPPAGADLGYLAAAPVFRLAARRQLASAADETGEPMRAAVELGASKLANWRVVAVQSQRTIEHNARRLRNETWLTAGAVWLVTFLAAAAVAARFGRRLVELADTVSAIGQGDFERRADPPGRFEPREFAVLVTQIAGMAERLSRQTRELETVVDERTAELASVNERLTILVNALERADDGIEITDPNARFVYVNPAFQKITGYSASELIGRTPALLRSSAQDQAFYDAMWQRVSSGQVYSGTLVGRRKGGTQFDQELTVWPIFDESGSITHFVGLRRDVTERRRTEQALRVSERMASLGTLAAGVAHEINNPLTYVLINLHYLHDNVTPSRLDSPAKVDRLRLAATRALEGAERVSAIVKDLRVLSRPDDRTIKLVDPRAVLDSALRMVGNDIRHHAELVENFHAVPSVMANEARLSQVFLNLLVNAVQSLEGALAKPARITVATGTDGAGRAVVEVGDTGCGIPPEHLHRIFDPFFTTKPVGLGTGIGLSLCHSTVKAMQGEIQVESTPGRGSLFRVVLPAANQAESERVAAHVTESVRRTLAPQRVLVMDDDLAVAEALRQALAGHDVTIVGSAEAGLEAAKGTRFTAIFCDVMMPGMTGIDFYERLSVLNPQQLARVVFMTGGVLTEAARRFLDQRSAPCLEKPVSSEQLEAVIARLAGERQALTSGIDPAPAA